MFGKLKVMNVRLNSKLAEEYSSASQKARVMTESWVLENAYCSASGTPLKDYENNKPVADFYCEEDKEDFELKSKKNSFGNKVVDGAYSTMIDRLKDEQNPNLFLLTYNLEKYHVRDFALVPRHFFTPSVIEKRKPLPETARRAGWTGCNILLEEIPDSGIIFYVEESEVKDRQSVFEKWNKTLFLREEEMQEIKGWLLEVMNCIDSLDKNRFELGELYEFEDKLQKKYPENSHIKEKIRQQLQVLRDRGYLNFEGNGVYQLN